MHDQRIPKTLIMLCRISGEDDMIIFDDSTDAGVAIKFAFIGLLVPMIFIVSVYSSVHFLVDLLNGNHIVATLIGLFWGAMIANIYYLLLFTVTPPLLKGRDHVMHGALTEVTTEKKALSWVSLVFRLLFVILLAIIIAQPWLVTIFDTSKWIDQERQAYRKEFRVDSPDRADHLLSANNFYTRRIRLIQTHYPQSWLVTSLVVLFFVAPIALKYQIRNKHNFYSVKASREETFVKNEYAQFKEQYETIFAENFGILVIWYESCVDPPFNTHKKDMSQGCADQQDLLARIYENEEDAEKHKYHVSQMIS